MRCFLSGLFTLALGAQALQSSEQPAPLPTPMEERVEVQLLQIPFVATDRQGRPVTDLTKDELRVKLRGEESTIVYLDRLATQDKNPSEVIPDVRLYLDAPGGWSEPVRASASTAYLAIVVDAENDTPARRDESIQQVLEFLGSKLDADLRIAVFSYSGVLKLEMPFTTNREAAKSSIRLAAAREGRPRVDPGGRIRKLVDQFDGCITQRGDFQSASDPRCVRDVANAYLGEMRPRSSDLVTALEGVVQYVGGLHGRKEVFVLSHGFPIDLSAVLMEAARGVFGNTDALSDLQTYVGFGDDPRVRMDRLIESLIRERIAMTVVDRTAPPSGDMSASRGQMAAPGTVPLRAEYDAAVADMEQIAVSSGGIHIRSTDLGAGLKKALDAREGSYELGVRLTRYLHPDKLTKIAITCSRKGVKIVHRRGAYAAPPQAEQTLRGRFAFGKGKPLEGDRAPGIHQSFAITIDPESIGYDVTDVEAHSNFTVNMLVNRTSDGRRLAETYHFVEHAYEKKVWDSSDRAPMTLSGWVELAPGHYMLEAWIRNVRTGKEGVIRQTVRVPDTLKPAQTSQPAPSPTRMLVGDSVP